MIYILTTGSCFVAGNIELLKYLLSKGVEVDSESDAGTPLIWAAGHAQPEAVKVLLEHHANVIFVDCVFFQCYITQRTFSIYTSCGTLSIIFSGFIALQCSPFTEAYLLKLIY